MSEVTWISPPEGTIKVNMDENSFNNCERSGLGDILCNNGDWLLGFFDIIEISTF